MAVDQESLGMRGISGRGLHYVVIVDIYIKYPQRSQTTNHNLLKKLVSFKLVVSLAYIRSIFFLILTPHMRSSPESMAYGNLDIGVPQGGYYCNALMQ